MAIGRDRLINAITTFLADLEQCLLSFCGERIAPVDFPSQKLVVLGRAHGHDPSLRLLDRLHHRFLT